MTRNFYEAVGNYGGYVCVGAMLSYGFAEELFKKYAGFPGLWTTGEPASGKTSLARWSCRIWGFVVTDGLALTGSTAVGIAILYQQYGSLPAWMDEYQPDCEDSVTQKLKEGFERKQGSKKTFGEPMRVVRAGVLVSGVATSPDFQLRSRYCHVHVAKENRIDHTQERYHWFQETSKNKFFLLGRYILEHRQEFARLAMEQMKVWMESKALQGCDSRSKIVHGASYAAFAAMVALLQSHPAEELRNFRNYMVAHVAKSVAEQSEKLYVNQFFTDLLAAMKAGEFGHTPSELKRYFKAAPVEGAERPAGITDLQWAEGQNNSLLAWKSYRLFFTNDVVERIGAYKKKVGSVEVALGLSDLRAQMSGKPYFVAKAGGWHQKFDRESPQRCMCIDLDKHEWGLVPQSDEDFMASLRLPDGNFLPTTDWCDPRRGPLFYILDALKPPRESQ
jgi:hypothetical protein